MPEKGLEGQRQAGHGRGSLREGSVRGSGRERQAKPLRLRDFIEDRDGWIYAVSAYDNADRAGCILRYVPDPSGDRVNPDGVRYRKVDFEEAFILAGEERLSFCAARDGRVGEVAGIFPLPPGSLGCTGSRVCGLEAPSSDIDLVVYGRNFFRARDILREAIGKGRVAVLSPETWRTIYTKREPEIPFEVFLLHERRKWNRGEIRGTYFDLLFTRSYDDLDATPSLKGEKIGRTTLEARVTDASLSFDSPAVYRVDHDRVRRILSFTHTYSGQALEGETVEARGVLEDHGAETWLVVGTTRTARGEYLISRTLMEEEG
jgi:predicted nucleotidyltransferase